MSRPISARNLDFRSWSDRNQHQRDIHLSNLATSVGPGHRKDEQSGRSLEVRGAPENGLEGDRTESDEYARGVKLFLIMTALCLSVFLFCLDSTILGVAIPKITDQFHSLNDVGWYGSAYLVTTCAFMPSFGQLYNMFSIKWVYLISLTLFEVGSLICGAAPSSLALIVGRAIAGIGCAGVGLGSLIVISHTVPLQRRPAFTGLVGGMHGVASAIGPVVGGILTDKLSWRWCFYINLPIGAIALIIVALVLKDSGPKSGPVGLLDRLKRIDIVGTALLIPAVVCIVLAFQWGGSVYVWKDAKIVALIVLGILLAFGFAIIQGRKGENSGIPPRILVKRSVACATLFNICCNSGFLLPTYYLPIWFQAIKATSALHSGVDTLPMILSSVVSTILGGVLVSVLGYYAPFMLLSSVLMSIGSGLLTTLVNTSTPAQWIGYQLAFGIGIGLGGQLPIIAVQAVLPIEEVASGIAITGFFQCLGGAIFLPVGQNVFVNNLAAGLQAVAPSIDSKVVANTGATNLSSVVPAEDSLNVLLVYNTAITSTFYVSVTLGVLSILGSTLIEWKSVKTKKAGDKG